MADCTDHHLLPQEGTFGVDNIANCQESNNLIVTTEGGNGQVRDESDQSESNNAKEKLVTSSEAESLEICSGNAETGQEDNNKLGRQQNQTTGDPIEPEQGKHGPIETGQAAWHGESDQDQSATGQGKDTRNVTEPGNSLHVASECEPTNMFPQTPTKPTTVYFEGILGVDSIASGQENNNLIVTTEGGNGQVRDESDQSESNNAKEKLVTGSEAESLEICSGNAETEQEDNNQLGRQQNQTTGDPIEPEQGKHGPIETEQAAWHGESDQDQSATGQGKDTRNVTEPGNSLHVASECEPTNMFPQTLTKPTTVYFEGIFGVDNIASGQENNNLIVTTEGGNGQVRDESDQSESNNAKEKLVTGSEAESLEICSGNAETEQEDNNQLGRQQNQTTGDPIEPEQGKHGPIETEQAAWHGESDQDQSATGQGKDTRNVTEPGNSLHVASECEPTNMFPQTLTKPTTVYFEGIFGVDNIASGQENNNLIVTTEGGNGQVRDESDQSESNNAKEKLVTSSEAESLEICSGNAETEQEDNNQLGRQQNQTTGDPIEPEQGKHGPIETEQAAWHGESDQDQSATGQGKDTRNVTEPGNSLHVANECEPTNMFPQTLTKPTTVYFYLLIVGESSINHAKIRFDREEIEIPLYQVPREKKFLWYLRVEFKRDPFKFPMKYKYSLNVAGYDFELRYYGKLEYLSTPSSNCEEDRERVVKRRAQLDVFQFPDSRNHVGKTIPRSVVWYLKWFLQFVEASTISEILAHFKDFISGDFSFKSLTTDYVKELITWILEKALDNSITDIQRLYLCMVLSHLSKSSTLLPPYIKGKKNVCDRFLKCFTTCVHSNFLSTSDLELLKKIAINLVENSNSPGWLTLAAHFYPYLGIKFLLDNKDAKFPIYRYGSEEYMKMVDALFSCLKVENRDDYKQLLLLVLDCAPTLVAALKLCELSEMPEFFANEDEMVDFFVIFFEKAQNRSEKRSSREKLVELHQMPEKIRGKIHALLYSTLLEYAKSDEELEGEDKQVPLKLIISMKDIGMDQLTEILMELSRSKSVPRQDLLLEILNAMCFKEGWLGIPLEKQVDICVSWVFSRVMNIRCESSLDSLVKVLEVYNSINDIMNCRLNVSIDKTLAPLVSTHLLEKNFETIDAASVLEAFSEVDKYISSVRTCYISHVKKILTQELIKKSCPILQKCSNNNLGRELLLSILEIIDVPDVFEDKETDKDGFKKILDWHDVWIILLRTGGMIERSKKYQVGKEICQRLTKRIELGDISLDFLEVLNKEKEKVLMLCALAKQESRQILEGRISGLMNVADDCSKKIELLELAINYGKNYSVNGIETVINTFNDLKENWRSKSVCEIQEVLETFPFLNPAEALRPLVNLRSFIALAEKYLKELSNSSADEDRNEATTVSDFYSLMVFLTTKAKEEFKKQWNPILKNPDSVDMETMNTLLGTLKDQNGLDEELKLLEEYFEEEFCPNTKIYIEDFLKYHHVLKQVQHLINILDIFGLADSEPCAKLLQSRTTLENSGDELTLALLHQSMKNVQDIVLHFPGEDLDGVIKELSSSGELVGFMEIIVDEDIRFLIDAVDEHSDQFVSESSVSDLIDVHGFLAPLIKKKNEDKLNAQAFLEMLKESCHGHRDLALKIQQCSTNVFSLRGLYMSISNRGETTKEIIRYCLDRGVYQVSPPKDGKCETKMSYVLQGSGVDKTCSYSLSDLHDLRSRAHLILSSHKNAIKVLSSHSNESSEDIDFEDFINQVNLVTEISTLLSKLRSCWHVKYRQFWKLMKTTNDLQTNRDSLKDDLDNWEKELKNAREKFYFLNYYRSDQLCTLCDFLMNGSKINYDEILSLIHFVDRTITKQQLKKYRESRESDLKYNPNLLLTTVGKALEGIFSNLQPKHRSMQGDGQNQTCTKLEATVTAGEIFVASLQLESKLTANVILALYENTSMAFPEPYQIVFCSSQTTWEELYLLLQRCFAHSKYLQRKSLFCVANVELLPPELQFKLVNAIKVRQNYHNSSEAMKDYQLALICRDHHHDIVEKFGQYSHHIAGMRDSVLSQRLQSNWPGVKIFTSTLPGLGKTEQIKHEVLAQGKNIAAFPISGPFEPCKLIQRLKELKLKKYHCLHLDIGEVSDPLLLDTFLFQLIVTGMISAGGQFYHLPTPHIYIEIANTQKDSLLDSLVVSKCFTRKHLKWVNYNDLIVSPEITSNVQVVCQYLDISDHACFETKEVHFSGPKKSMPLSAHRCQKLLARCFSSDADITFAVMNTFLGILADQLLKFSDSAFFTIENLESMMSEHARGVRNNLFLALLSVSKEFASRALTTCRSSDTRSLSQKQSARALDKTMVATAKSDKNMVERVKEMIKWEHSNHLLVVFQGLNSQAITAIYRNKALVPLSVEKLLKSQGVRGNTELEDFKAFTQEQLQAKLEKIACTKLVEKNNLFASYALTPDNILKMILIILRIRVNAPVIIMGETGCGKTSLVRYLANTCGVQFYPFNFHAGISEEEIIEFINEKEKDAKKNIKEQIWIFLDEINTCDHLGLISDIMCHHSLFGRPLSNNLVFLAACNPYKERPEEHVETAGLKSKKNITDEYSKLVYRVYPLPEAMLDYVWDYGSLTPGDERDYIKRMVRDLPEKSQGMLVDLLAASQTFIRVAEKNSFCVSLRDVNRCIILINWFEEMKEKRQKINTSIKKDKCPKHLQEYLTMSERYETMPMIKSIVLALAHCYLSRLPTAELRKKYRKEMIDLFSRNGTIMTYKTNSDSFAAIVRMEEEDYLDRMELPPGTARNVALRENVFVILVCILNRIPIFVVGKPGCSKSLSIQLIRSNLRGRDSRDPLFKELPQLYFVSYQGSESSTSEGILKVFEKARKYKSHNKDGNALPVVLLDEVGLAENSKYNPLKVLHGLLEPGEGKLHDVAVVGISNWSLDAAKMNRAIHLSRPEPTKDDLYETGQSLHCAEGGDHSRNLGKEGLQCLAEAYFEYQCQQSPANFHGLRDYYSLIKCLVGYSNFQQVNTSTQYSKFQKVNISLQRNFGGLPKKVTNIQKIFLDKFKLSSDQEIIPVIQLIQENLADPLARHLMLITSGDSAIGFLKQSLAQLEKETITIYGSRFEEDLSEDYDYRILSRIILCMERDCILILRDLESIYGSLYDMLNQNYAVVGNRKNCRVALGPYSNPMCQVNDGFRCIVLIDQHKVDSSDPPFLNRFEKQVLRFFDVLTEGQHNVVIKLRRWVEGMSTVEGSESHFNESDMFIGFHEDTLPSLVLSHGHDTESPSNEVLKKCKDDLMWIASPGGVLRTQRCNFLKEDSQEVQELSDDYFKKPLHQGFAAFMEYVVTNHQKLSFFASDDIGSKTVVMTFSNIHTDIRQCLGNGFRCQIERLSACKSEKQLAERINEFWSTPEKELLVLQCKPDLDATHLLLARSIIEEKRNSYKQCLSEVEPQGPKHVCIVVHVQRGEAADDVPWQFTFLCGWRQVFLDVLEAPLVPLNEILGESVQRLLTSSIWPIRTIAQNFLLWCFTCIKHTRSQRPLNTVLHIAKDLFNSEKVWKVTERLILQSIDLDAPEQDQEIYFKENWQVKVACDRQSLVNSSTLYCAMEQFVFRSVRNPLAKIVYFLEKENAWPPHLVKNSNETLISHLEDLWCNFIMNNDIFKISEIPEPRGAQSYVLENMSLDLCLPFSHVFSRKIDGVKELFLEDYAKLVENEENLDENGRLTPTVQQQQLERFSKRIIYLVPELHCFISDCYDLYMKDIFDTMTADFSPMLSRRDRVYIAEATFVSEVKQNLPANDMAQFITLLHIFVWVHREQILDLLRMVDRCQPFVPLNLVKLTNGIFCSSEKVMLVKGNETNLFQEESSAQENNGKTSEGSNSGSQETEDSATNANESTYNTVLNLEAEPKADETVQSKTKLGCTEVEFQKASSDLQDNEGAVKEEMQSERFGDILVTAYCEEMFPSKELVKKNGGIESWLRNANLLLSLGLKISEYPTALHYFRLCIDFSRIVFTSTALPTHLSSLYLLNEVGIALRPKYLDNVESFKIITNQLIKPLRKEMKDQTDKHKALQKFSALFYGRCFDTNVDTSSARSIVAQVLSLKQPDLVMMMSPVVLHLLTFEEKHSPGIFMDVINDQSVIENCPCLQLIDKVFKDRFLKGLIHHDSYSAVMICDLIQRLLHFENRFIIADNGSSDLDLVRSATILVSQNSEDGGGLRVLSAVAFLRGFFTMLAQYIAGNPNVLKEDSASNRVMTEVNSLLKGANSSLQVFFMKQLHEDASLFDLQTWFGQNNVLPAMDGLWRKEENHDKAVFTSVFMCTKYEEAKAAYLRKMESDDDSSMLTFLSKCGSSPNHAFSLLGLLVNMVYLKRTMGKLTDKEEQLVNWFATKVASFPTLFQELLLRIIGHREFWCPQLQLSPESSVEEVEMALLVIHVACVVATSVLLDEKLPMYRYFTNSDKFERSCVLAHCNEDVRFIFEHQSSVKESTCVTCACGSRLAFKSNVNEKKCPHCPEVLSDETRSSTSPETASTLLISYNGDVSPEWDLCTQHMSPAAYRALHFIVYSSYYAGIALETSSEENLSSVLNMLHGLNFDSDSTSPASFCFETITTDLSYLMKILSCKKDVAIKTMHLVVERSSYLIRSKNLLGANDRPTPEMRREWETMFSQHTETVFLNARETSKEIKETIKRQQALDSQESTLECRILELDDYPEDQEEQEKQLKRLFRFTKRPSFEDFRSAFLFSPKDVQAKHTFLMLFFEKYNQLPSICNLHHLLKWSRLVSSALTHRISRKNAESKSINDFINGHLLELKRSPQETENLKELFNNFKEAWNKMRPLVNQELISKRKEKMPWLIQSDYVAYCLTESDCGIYLETAIKILVSFQNRILDGIISLSSEHQHLALNFLENENGSGVMSASIQAVKEKEIITFQWSDDLFKYAQNNPEYGRGQEITYDFERIEVVLATEIAFEKRYLTGTLNKFIFAKELFHSCGPLLTEIRSLMTRSSSLPEEVYSGLRELKERRIKEAQDLLQHIEVLIYMLKRNLKNFNVDMTLEELANEWSPMLPSPFPVNLLPQPRSAIKIEHVAALYEALEDILADGAIDGLDDKFRDELPDDMKDTISAVVGNRIDQLKPHDFLKALRRFVFRYLSSETEQYWPEESETFKSCLKEPSLWSPIESPPNLDVIPQEITLKYIYSMVKCLEGLSHKGKKDNTSKSSSRQLRKRPGGGRRQLRGYSRA